MPGATPWGTEFLVNTSIDFDQEEPSIAALPNGRFAVVWTSVGVITAQIFNADGSPSGAEFPVDTTSSGDAQPSVTVLTSGRFVVTWSDFGQTLGDGDDWALHGQIFEIDGTPVGTEFLVNTTTAHAQFDSSITALDGGGFVVGFKSNNGVDYDILAQIFDANGAKVSEIPTGTAGIDAVVAGLHTPDGRYVAVWTGGDGSGEGISVQLHAADGAPIGIGFSANTTNDDAQTEAAVAALAGGNFVVVWSDASLSPDDTSGLAVRGQVFNSNGAPIGIEFLVNTTTLNAQHSPSVAALDDGRFVVVWTDGSGDGGTDPGDIRGQVFNADGTHSGNEFLINTITDGSQTEVKVAALADGRFVVSWTDASLGDDDSSGNAVRARIFDPRETGIDLAGTDFDDDYIGSDFDDTLNGGLGNDTLAGGDGNDTFEGGAGADRLIGGNGIDTASYATSAAGVTIILGGAAGFNGDAQGDSINGIENITGSAHADTITGNGGPNLLRGGGGDDTLNGGFGIDDLRGGAGNDILDGGDAADAVAGGDGDDVYSVDSLDTVTEAANEGFDTVTASASFTLSDNIEMLILTGAGAIDGVGNAIANTIVGNGAANTLSGGGGADTLLGGLGIDDLRGGAGNDALDGGDGADAMAGGGGDDTCFVDNTGDGVSEAAGDGADTVIASVSFALSDNVETLILTGATAIDGAGNAMANTITGNGAANTLSGGGGDDLIDGGLGSDTLNGGAGDDTYILDSAGDVVNEAGGAGTDTVRAGFSYTLGANTENFVFTGATDANGVGNALANFIAGNSGANVLDGGAGGDRLIGGGGGDTLIGGAAKDLLAGSGGLDRLTGGGGKDAFLFDTALDALANFDRITDFSVAKDTIQLDDAIFAGLSLGGLKASAFFAGDKAHDANDRIVYNEKKGILTYDANGDDAGGAVKFARLGKHLSLDHDDFFVV